MLLGEGKRGEDKICGWFVVMRLWFDINGHFAICIRITFNGVSLQHGSNSFYPKFLTETSRFASPPRPRSSGEKFLRRSKWNIGNVKNFRFRILIFFRFINTQNALGSFQNMVVGHYRQIVIAGVQNAIRFFLLVIPAV